MSLDQGAADRVIAALDGLGEQLWQASRVVSGDVLGPSALAAVAGFGLSAAGLTASAEWIAFQLTEIAVRSRADAQTARQWSQDLLDSQIASTSGAHWGAAWAGVVHRLEGGVRVDEAAVATAIGGKWWARAAQYAGEGTLISHAREWKWYGYADRAMAPGAAALFTAAGHFIPGARGDFLGAVGGVGTSLVGFAQLNWTGISQLKLAFRTTTTVARSPAGRLLGKAVLPLAVMSTGLEALDLAGPDWQERRDGDAAHHSDTTRNVIYGAKVADTLGSTLMIAGGATFNPWVFGAGAALVGVSSLTRGAIALNDMAREVSPPPEPSTVATAPAGGGGGGGGSW